MVQNNVEVAAPRTRIVLASATTSASPHRLSTIPNVAHRFTWANTPSFRYRSPSQAGSIQLAPRSTSARVQCRAPTPRGVCATMADRAVKNSRRGKDGHANSLGREAIVVHASARSTVSREGADCQGLTGWMRLPSPRFQMVGQEAHPRCSQGL